LNIGIRKATAEDYTAICALFDEIDALHRDNLPHLFKKPNGPSRELDYFLGLISDENVGFFVAELDGGLVGFVHTFIKAAPDIPVVAPRRYAILDGILVKSEIKHQGVGRMLIETIEEWTAAKGASSIELNVYEFNQVAITFYEMLGYKALSRKLAKEL
jgi:GNAT superfamily N-acetyltransferase